MVGKVPIVTKSSVEDAAVDGNRVRLRLLSGDTAPSELTVDHVIAATGYRVDVDRIAFLDETLRERIDTVDKTPIPSSAFESGYRGSTSLVQPPQMASVPRSALPLARDLLHVA
jgi:hypothetical protein